MNYAARAKINEHITPSSARFVEARGSRRTSRGVMCFRALFITTLPLSLFFYPTGIISLSVSGADRRLRGPANEEHLPRRRSPRCPRRRRIIYGGLKLLCDGDLRYRAAEKDHGGFLLCNMWPARVSSYEGTTGLTIYTGSIHRERTCA